MVKVVGQGFEINREQFKKLRKWQNSLPKLSDKSTIGGAYTYEFTPTSLGLVIFVKRVDGREINLTEFSKW